MLRDYQQRAIDELYKWFAAHKTGHPCLVLPTGSGKSHIVAALCKDALQNWPQTRVLMLTHQKELIEQNAAKLRQHWKGAPLGIYSASVGRKELGEPITFAGIQSVRNKANLLGHIDLVIVDEAHLINHKHEGGYRQLICDLEKINPNLRVIGLTATPYRLGHGLITDGDALFDDLIKPVTIEELIYKGYLAPLRSKFTAQHYDVSSVHKRGGEYIERELQAAVDTDDQNAAVVDEIIRHAGERKAWLFFCAGVEHAEHVAAELNRRGIPAASISGKTTKRQRESLIEQFKEGEIRALTNANVLTTGFDYPDIDLIALLRPTLSPSLYVQMAGRGMRIKSHTDHCLVLDFAGVVSQHGPVTAVQPPKKAGSGTGEAPVKICDNCAELVHPSVMICPSCGFAFPEPEKKPYKLHNDDIMGIEAQEMAVSAWAWRTHTSRASGKEMVKVTYYGALSDKPVTEYLPVLHNGYAGIKAMSTLAEIARNAATTVPDSGDLVELCDSMNQGFPPSTIGYKMEGKFYRVINREWGE